MSNPPRSFLHRLDRLRYEPLVGEAVWLKVAKADEVLLGVSQAHNNLIRKTDSWLIDQQYWQSGWQR